MTVGGCSEFFLKAHLVSDSKVKLCSIGKIFIAIWTYSCSSRIKKISNEVDVDGWVFIYDAHKRSLSQITTSSLGVRIVNY